MASNNRVFSYLSPKLLPPEKNFSAIFDSFSSHLAVLVLLLFYYNLDSCSTPHINATILWKDDIGNNEGKHFELLMSDLGLHQCVNLVAIPYHQI